MLDMGGEPERPSAARRFWSGDRGRRSAPYSPNTDRDDTGSITA